MQILKDESLLRVKVLDRPRDKLTLTNRYIIYKALEARMSISRAISLANISRSAFERWMKKGEDPTNIKFHSFRNKVNEIRANNEAESLEIIRLAQKGGFQINETRVVISDKQGKSVTRIKKTTLPSWQAAAWYLERCCTGYELKQPIEDVQKTSDEIALEIAQAISEIEGTVSDEDR